jgi:hypothetical protein
MNNLVLITSVICTPNNTLSYTDTRSVFTHDERFIQTKKTIETVKEKIPNAKILLVECSKLNEHQKEYFLTNADYFLNLFNDPEKCANVYGKSKSLGEGTMTYCALEYVLNNNIIFDNLIKISGRYWLSDNFNYINFDNSDIVIKYIDNDHDNVFTALYKIPMETVLNFKRFLQNKFNEMRNCIGYEVLFSNFIKTEKNLITHINPIGLDGYVSVSKEFYSG